jgi:molybdopterin adenylyltransferase
MITIQPGKSIQSLSAGDKFILLHPDDYKRLTQSTRDELGIISGIEKTELKDFDLFVGSEASFRIDKIGKRLKKSRPNPDELLIHQSGIFCTLIEGKLSHEENSMEHDPKIFNSLVITLSDRASRGEYADLSGPFVIEALEELFTARDKRFRTDYKLIPDNRENLSEILTQSTNKYDVILSTGGTGIGPRDFTVDVVKPLLNMEIPGIMEMIRMKYGSLKPNAYLSRGVAGIFGSALIYTLPGSVKAVREYMDEITKTLDHLFYMKEGIDVH